MTAPAGGKGGAQQGNIMNQSAGAYNQALQATRAGGMMQPGTIAQGMGQYFNPYENQVVQNSLQDIESARQMQINQGGAQATAAGAFGGSRHGVAESLTNQAALQQAGNTAANLRQQGFNQAGNFAAQDIGNRLAGQSNLLGAGAQMGNLSRQGFDMGRTLNQDMARSGQQQQMLQQMLIDSAKAQYGGFTGAPQQALQTQLGAFGASQTGQQTNTSQRNPGLFDYLTLGASLL